MDKKDQLKKILADRYVPMKRGERRSTSEVELEYKTNQILKLFANK